MLSLLFLEGTKLLFLFLCCSCLECEYLWRGHDWKYSDITVVSMQTLSICLFLSIFCASSISSRLHFVSMSSCHILAYILSSARTKNVHQQYKSSYDLKYLVCLFLFFLHSALIGKLCLQKLHLCVSLWGVLSSPHTDSSTFVQVSRQPELTSASLSALLAALPSLSFWLVSLVLSLA